MKENEKALSALLAVFPTPETLVQFSENMDNKKTLESFMDFAFRNNLIRKKDRKSLLNLINQHGRSTQDLTPPNNLTFEELLEKKKGILKLNFSGRVLTDRVNALIAEQRIELPKVSNSMLTRLKKESTDTAHKENVLRSLAFWLGHERKDLGPLWNFETLVKLCGERKPQENYREGVRIGFALYSQGDVIDHDIINWLRKALKNYIEQSVGHFLYGRWGKVRSHDITTLFLDFPKEEEAEDPAYYHQCLRSAVSLAHQIAIRWALSKHCTKNRFLSIGIAAGEYANLDNYLLPTLKAKLPGDPVIRVTDYVRQCLLINDIRAILCEHPNEITLFTGESLTIWWVVALWSNLYFDFVPDLLEDQILKNTPASIEALTRLLWLSPDERPNSAAINEPNAVTTFFKFPHNSLLGVEIAKTLYFRRRFWEALEILRIVLSLDPTHLVARTLRMVLFHNLALDTPSYTAAEYLFNQSEHEAFFIEKNCTNLSEDFYCEYGLCYQTKAMLMVRLMRQGQKSFPDLQDLEQSREIVFLSLNKAENLFEKGMTVSPSGIRSSFLLSSVRMVKSILKNNKDLFINPKLPIDSNPEIIRQTGRDLYLQLGFLRHELPPQLQHDFLIRSVYSKVEIHDSSISLQNYRATTYFCTAVVLWDFVPFKRTAAIAKKAVQLINDAKEIAQALEKNDLSIYSFNRALIEMVPVKEFVRQMEKSLQMIKEYVGRDLTILDDQEIIESDGSLSSILMTLNF